MPFLNPRVKIMMLHLEWLSPVVEGVFSLTKIDDIAIAQGSKARPIFKSRRRLNRSRGGRQSITGDDGGGGELGDDGGGGELGDDGGGGELGDDGGGEELRDGDGGEELRDGKEGLWDGEEGLWDSVAMAVGCGGDGGGY
nr:TATA-binding protein-associated factor 2N-like [Arachis hypogaea]